MCEQEKYFVYILQSLKDKNFYIGRTGDLDKRIKLHNKGSVKSTRSRRPFRLIHTELYTSRSEACKRETFLKKPEGYQEKSRIISKFKVF